jgi:type II secretory pathway component GspD/PulD (secretin)
VADAVSAVRRLAAITLAIGLALTVAPAALGGPATASADVCYVNDPGDCVERVADCLKQMDLDATDGDVGPNCSYPD